MAELSTKNKIKNISERCRRYFSLIPSLFIPIISHSFSNNFTWAHHSTVFYANHIRPEFNILREIDFLRISRQLRLFGYKRVFLIQATNGNAISELEERRKRTLRGKIFTKCFYEPIWVEKGIKNNATDVRRILSALTNCKEPYACLIFPTGDWNLNDGMHSSLNLNDVKTGFIGIADTMSISLCPILVSNFCNIMKIKIGKQFKTDSRLARTDRLAEIWQKLIDLQF